MPTLREKANHSNGHMTFDINLMETSLCLWEAFVDMEAGEKPNQLLREFRAQHGSWECRHAIIALTPLVEELWNSMSDDERDGYTFDFEFCPDVILHAVDWPGALTHSNARPGLVPHAKERLVARRALEAEFNEPQLVQSDAQAAPHSQSALQAALEPVSRFAGLLPAKRAKAKR